MLNELLQNTLKFTQNDLDANKAGYVSKDQQKKLRRNMRRQQLISIVLIMISLYGYYAMYNFSIANRIIIFVIMSIIMISAFAGLLVSQIKKQELTKPDVQFELGSIELHKRRVSTRYNSFKYWMNVNNIKFEIKIGRAHV